MPEAAAKQKRGPGYSRVEFARLTGLSFRRVAGMIEKGELKTVSFGGFPSRIPPSELERVMALLEIEDSNHAA